MCREMTWLVGLSAQWVCSEGWRERKRRKNGRRKKRGGGSTVQGTVVSVGDGMMQWGSASDGAQGRRRRREGGVCVWVLVKTVKNQPEKAICPFSDRWVPKCAGPG